jgi:hypothetical protein
MPAKRIHTPETEKYARGHMLARVLTQIIDGAMPVVAHEYLGGYATDEDIATAMMIILASFVFARGFKQLDTVSRFSLIWQALVDEKEQLEQLLQIHKATLELHQSRPLSEC